MRILYNFIYRCLLFIKYKRYNNYIGYTKIKYYKYCWVKIRGTYYKAYLYSNSGTAELLDCKGVLFRYKRFTIERY